MIPTTSYNHPCTGCKLLFNDDEEIVQTNCGHLFHDLCLGSTRPLKCTNCHTYIVWYTEGLPLADLINRTKTIGLKTLEKGEVHPREQYHILDDKTVFGYTILSTLKGLQDAYGEVGEQAQLTFLMDLQKMTALGQHEYEPSSEPVCNTKEILEKHGFSFPIEADIKSIIQIILHGKGHSIQLVIPEFKECPLKPRL